MRWLRRSQREQDLERELQAHLELEAEERQAEGISERDARFAARRALGNPSVIAEEVREMWGWTFLDRLAQDIRYALRVLRKAPGFTAVAVLTLALGIGANTAIFSVVDAVLLNSLPYPEADRLVVVWEQNPARGWFRNTVSAANFIDWRKQNHVFAGMAAIEDDLFDISGTGEPVEARGERVSADLFSVLGVRPALGRTFSPGEDRPSGQRAVILSHDLWIGRYGGDPRLAGRSITVNRSQFTVVGIMPAGFYFPPWDNRAELWVAGLDLRNPDRDWHSYSAVARLRAGITMARAQSAMDTIAARLERVYPAQKGWGVGLVNVHEQAVGNTRPALLVLWAAVGMVLLIACANLANLQLVRMASREREMAVRAALGGARHRLVRQLLTESLCLALGGGLLGVLLAVWGVRLLVKFGPADVSGLSQASINGHVLLFAMVLAIATGIAFGVLPALGASRTDLTRRLREGGRHSAGVRGRRVRSVLVSAEFALALILLLGAGLLIRTMVALRQVDLGFNTHNVLSMRIALLGSGYAAPGKPAAFFRNLLKKVEALPGVASAAVIDGEGLPPLGGSGMDFLIEGRPAPPPNETPDAFYRVISPNYFRTIGAALQSGRLFTEADNENAPRVAIISERLARDYWGGGNPLGSRISFPGLGGSAPTWFSIVGVVNNVKNLGFDLKPREEIYVPYDQYPAYFAPRTLVVRTFVDPLQFVDPIRREVQRLDPDQPISEVKTMDRYVTELEAGRRFPMLLLALFAGLAVALASIGIYGVMSYSVNQRRHEIGLRVALGAQREAVLRTILAEGMRMAGVGLVVGIAAGLVATRGASKLLYGVKPADPLTFLTMVLFLLAVGFVAAYLPARLATRIDPMLALRHE